MFSCSILKCCDVVKKKIPPYGRNDFSFAGEIWGGKGGFAALTPLSPLSFQAFVISTAGRNLELPLTSNQFKIICHNIW